MKPTLNHVFAGATLPATQKPARDEKFTSSTKGASLLNDIAKRTALT